MINILPRVIFANMNFKKLQSKKKRCLNLLSIFFLFQYVMEIEIFWKNNLIWRNFKIAWRNLLSGAWQWFLESCNSASKMFMYDKSCMNLKKYILTSLITFSNSLTICYFWLQFSPNGNNFTYRWVSFPF